MFQIHKNKKSGILLRPLIDTKYYLCYAEAFKNTTIFGSSKQFLTGVLIDVGWIFKSVSKGSLSSITWIMIVASGRLCLIMSHTGECRESSESKGMQLKRSVSTWSGIIKQETKAQPRGPLL